MNNQPLCFDCRIPMIYSATLAACRCTHCRAEVSETQLVKLGWKPPDVPLSLGEGYSAIADIFGGCDTSKVVAIVGSVGQAQEWQETEAASTLKPRTPGSILAEKLAKEKRDERAAQVIDPIDGEPLPPELTWLVTGFD